MDFELSGLAQDEREFLSEAVVSFMVCLLAIYLTLTWILVHGHTNSYLDHHLAVGVVWGNYIPACHLMFSVVGFIGMAGIILNDTIVLIVRIQEHMRPNLLDSLIQGPRTVYGQCFDRTDHGWRIVAAVVWSSVQAQFLKPTVITWCTDWAWEWDWCC